MAMFGKGWTLRYAWHKMLQSIEAGTSAGREAAKQVHAAGADPQASREAYRTVSDAVQAGILKHFSAPLTSVIKFTGPAMAPLLNRAAAAQNSTAHEFLLTYRLHNPPPEAVRTGDVVAFKHPLAGVDPTGLMVRRVTAAGGDTLEGDDPTQTLLVRPGTVWVTADNPDLEPPHIEDSRTFGPLDVALVVGRCVYAVRSRADRQPIANNEAWRAIDRDVVAAELTDELLDKLDGEAR